MYSRCWSLICLAPMRCYSAMTFCGSSDSNISPRAFDMGLAGMQVGRGRQFTPSDDDCYSTLKVDVVVVDSMSRTPYLEIGKTFTSATARVRLAPKLPKRALIPLASPKASTAPGKFSVVTYNLLADLYTNVSPPEVSFNTAMSAEAPCMSSMNQEFWCLRIGNLWGNGWKAILHVIRVAMVCRQLTCSAARSGC